jgi:hypothetical protein
MKNEDIVAELQARDIEVTNLKEQLKELREVVNNNKAVLFDLLEVLKNSKIPQRTK